MLQSKLAYESTGVIRLPKKKNNSGFTSTQILLVIIVLAGIVGVTVLFGQAVAIPIFILGYLIIRGKTTWAFAFSYALISGVILYFMFGELIGILWYPSIFIDYG